MPIQPKQQPPYYNTGLPTKQEYTALVSQTSTNDPTAIILQNTFNETITLNYISTGNYEISKTTPFTIDKCAISINQDYNDPTTGGKAVILDNEDGTFRIKTYDGSNALADGYLYKTTINIQQFNY